MKTELDLNDRVCVGWSLCSTWEIHQDRPPHSHTLSLTRTNISKSPSSSFLSKSHNFIIQLFVTEKQDHSCSGRSLKFFFSINSVHIIYFMNTLISFPTIQCRDNSNLQTFTGVHSYAVILCSFLLAGKFSFIKVWTSVLLLNIKSAALHIIYNHSQKLIQSGVSITDGWIKSSQALKVFPWFLHFSVLCGRELSSRQWSEMHIWTVGVQTWVSCFKPIKKTDVN